MLAPNNVLTFLFSVLILSVGQPALATTVVAKPSSVALQSYHHQPVALQGYQRLGQLVLKSLQADFMAKRGDVELLNQKYSSQLKIERLAFLPSLFGGGTKKLVDDTNLAIQLKSEILAKGQPSRQELYRIQSIFTGLMFTIETLSRVHLGQSLDELLTLERYLLSKSALVNLQSSKIVSLSDIGYDFIWLRNLEYPTDLTLLSIDKIERLSEATKDKKLAATLWSYKGQLALTSLRKHSSFEFGGLNGAASFEKLVSVAKKASESKEQQLREIKWLEYRFLQKMGRGSEAYDLKNSLYMDQLGSKTSMLVHEPLQIWQREETGAFKRVAQIVTSSLRNIFLVGKYSVGFLFIATPLEFIVLLIAFLILAHQGYRFFGETKEQYIAIVTRHQVFSRGGWRRVPALFKATGAHLLWYMNLAWRMFVTTYTGTTVPFYSKVASSMLLFGIGLYFNSAKNLAETLLSLS